MWKGQMLHLSLFLITTVIKAAGAYIYALVSDLSGPGRTRSLPKDAVCRARKDGRMQVTHSA